MSSKLEKRDMIGFLKTIYIKKRYVRAMLLAAALINAAISQAQSPALENNRIFVPYKTILIDPGHGGHNHGAKGLENTLEKTVSLTLAQIIADRLGRNYRVSLTRTHDYGINILDRTERANNLKADLFLSIHTGASFLHKAGGMTVYYFRGEVQKKETLPSDPLHPFIKDNELIHWADIQNKHLESSESLAKALHSQLSDNIKDISVNIQSAPIAVLSGADMPAVLLEVGCLTNPLEEKRLNDQKYLWGLADSICRGIELFFKKNR